MTHLEDPELLPARCREPNARRLVLDAVRSHQAGAVRSAIVSIWIAVVYDLFGKLRELSQSGDGGAREFVEKIDRAVNGHDIAEAQRIEATILEDARDRFELLSHSETEDLERLRSDRHRCAHPSMNRPEEMYVPAAELVRMHLRNAVVHLLSQPPVQGKAALALLQREVDSDLFPKATSDAAEYLRTGMYRRMKPTLLRAFCCAAIASCLTDESVSLIQFLRRVRALNALRMLTPDSVNGALVDKLTAAARKTAENSVHRIVLFAALVHGSTAWLEQDVRLRVLAHIPQAEQVEMVLFALAIPEFIDVARARLRTASEKQLVSVLGVHPELSLPPAARTEVLTRVIQDYVGSKSWDSTNRLASTLVLPNIAHMSKAQVATVLEAFSVNKELHDSATRSEVLRGLFARGDTEIAAFDAALASCSLTRDDLTGGMRAS